MKSDLFDLHCNVLHITEKAVLIDAEDGKEVWIPKTQCELEVESTGYQTISMPEWLADKKGLI